MRTGAREKSAESVRSRPLVALDQRVATIRSKEHYPVRSIRVFSLACLAALAIAVTACGSETNDYRKDVSSIQEKYVEQLQQQATTASQNIQSDPTAAAASLDQLAATSNKMADEIAAVDPPDDKQQLADQLVGAYRQLGTSALELKQAVATNDLAKLSEAAQGFNDAQMAEASAIEAFNKAD
jgi:hypothetical protein